MKWRRTGFIDDSSTHRLPSWLHPLAQSVPRITTDHLTRFSPTDDEGTHAAVLVLFGEGPDVLLIERARGDAAHSGQPAFPGGVAEQTDADAFATALRETQEETGADPEGITVFGALPDLWVPVSDFVVSPVLGWWHSPSAVQVQDHREVSRVARVQVDTLVDPANRCTVVHPSGYRGPGFRVEGMLVWGFTAGVLSGVIEQAGWSRPWDRSITVGVA